jgi:hypothetical protein
MILLGSLQKINGFLWLLFCGAGARTWVFTLARQVLELVCQPTNGVLKGGGGTHDAIYRKV